MSGPVLVELCAGSAALTSRLLASEKPPWPYAGGKARWASRLIRHLEIETPERVVLVDPGPCGQVWRDLPRCWQQVLPLMEHLADHENPLVPAARDLWDLLRAGPVPDDPVRYIAAFLCLQTWHYRSKPVGQCGTRWLARAGYSKTHAEGDKARGTWGEVGPQLGRAGRSLRALGPFLGRVRGYRCSALDLEPAALLPGVRPRDVLCYIDPPYAGTTGYGPDDLSRGQVLALAEAWARWGARVAISEAEPIPGWRAIQLGEQSRSSGLSGTSEGRVEWVSLSWKRPQLRLF